MKTKSLKLILFITICLNISIPNLKAEANNNIDNTTNKKVNFLFQSISNRNSFELVEDNNLNILYINEKCLYCFSRIQEVINLNPKSKFIVVVASNTWQNLKTLVDKNCKSDSAKKIIYYDPGRRFQKALQLTTEESSYIRFSKGKVSNNDTFTLSQNLKNPYTLKTWQ